MTASFMVRYQMRQSHLAQTATPHILRHTGIAERSLTGSRPKILRRDCLTTITIYLNFTDAYVVEEYAAKW